MIRRHYSPACTATYRMTGVTPITVRPATYHGGEFHSLERATVIACARAR